MASSHAAGRTRTSGHAGDDAGVLVVGAGPTGLALAIELARRDVPCRVVDRSGEWSQHSRGLGIQARTIEVFEDLGVAEAAVATGQRIGVFNVYLDGRRISGVSFDGLDSPYNFTLALEQSHTERLLRSRLEELGVAVERPLELTGLSQDRAGVTVELRDARGEPETARYGWVVGCDGAHSTVRHLVGMSFEGAPYEEEFLLGDFEIGWALSADEAHAFVYDGGLLAAVPLGSGRYRLIGTRTVSSEGGDQSEQAILTEFHGLVRRLAPPGTVLSDPVWLGGFRIHRRMVSRLREKRVLVAGDAAHIHSPVGGLGLNTGVQDAHNLGWKLALVAHGASDELLLDTYNSERHPVAATTLRFTDLATRGLIVARSRVLRAARRHVVPRVLSLGPVQRRVRDALSQLGIRYGPSAIVAEGVDHADRLALLQRGVDKFLGRRNGPVAGERAPDAPISEPGRDPMTRRLFEVFRDPRYVLLLFDGRTGDDDVRRRLSDLAGSIEGAYGRHVIVRRVRLEGSPPDPAGSALLDTTGRAHERYGATEPCFYLVRPDGYVGFRGMSADGQRLRAHLGQVVVDAPAYR